MLDHNPYWLGTMQAGVLKVYSEQLRYEPQYMFGTTYGFSRYRRHYYDTCRVTLYVYATECLSIRLVAATGMDSGYKFNNYIKYNGLYFASGHVLDLYRVKG